MAAERIVDAIGRIFGGESCSGIYSIDFEPKIYRSCGCHFDAPSFNMGERLKNAHTPKA